jgi:hypothetical protein
MISDLDFQRANYPRVSHIIGSRNENQYSGVAADVLENACIRGRKIHEYCTAEIEGLWIPDIEEEYKPYYQAFKSWLHKKDAKILSLPKRLYDDEKKFTGEFDFIIEWDGLPMIVDIKTSAIPSKTWGVQLAAYAMLCRQDEEMKKLIFDCRNELSYFTTMNLHLKKKKCGDSFSVNPVEIFYSVEERFYSEVIFNHCLSCYDYFNRKETK